MRARIPPVGRGRGARARRVARRAERSRDPLRRQRRPAEAARQHPPRRSGRRRDQLEGTHLRLHAHRRRRTRRVGTSRTFYKAGSRLFEFDQTGKFVREIGVGVYGFNFAQAVRIDPQDNIWVVDRGIDAGDQVRSRRPHSAGDEPQAGSDRGARAARRAARDAARRRKDAAARRRKARGVGGAARLPGRRAGGAAAAAADADRPDRPGAGIPGDSFVRTADVAWDAQGNIYVADGQGDGIGNARVAKFDKDGHFIKSWGSARHRAGTVQLAARHRDRRARATSTSPTRGNKRIQVFDGDGNPKAQIASVGVPAGDLHHARRASVPVQLELERRRDARQRRDLQDGARRQDRRQVRPRRPGCRRSSAW